MDTIDWLLDSDPAVSWQAMRDLTDASPAAVAAERGRVAREGIGAEILVRQGPDGSWHRTDAPDWLPTLFTLLLLRSTGVDRAESAVDSAVARPEAGFRWDEEFGAKQFFEGEVEPCINGGTLALGAYFGRPTESLARRLVGEQLEDGWNCEAPKSPRSSFHTTSGIHSGRCACSVGTSDDGHCSEIPKEQYVIRIQTALAASLLSLATISTMAEQPASSQSNFKVVETPGGGQYIYGPINGKGTMPDALVYMLHQIHTYVGDRPEVGKFFQSRDGTTVSTFFTATAKTRGNLPIAGLLIVSRAADGSASAAVILDERSRFGSSEPAMMKSLSAVWHPIGGESSVMAHQHGPAALTQTTGGDRSASISLPAGWKLTSVASGTLTATGPNGEMVALGMLYQGFAMGPDLFENFVNISNQYRRKNGLQPGRYTVTSKTNVPGNAIQVMYNVDLNDGVGLRKGSVRLGLWGPSAMSVDGSNIPARFADEENPTLLAVIRSYQQNEQMMAQQRQGAMNRVQADAARGQAQAAALNARREASNAAFDQHMNGLNAQSNSFNSHMDDIDRSSKINQDYILDRTVVRDNENAERATLSNSYADSLVRNNPDRFQIVPNQDLIKGKDF